MDLRDPDVWTVVDAEIEGVDFSGSVLDGKVVEDCTFRECRFVGVTFTDCRFVTCSFEDCDLSGVNFSGVALHEVRFQGCKLRGVDFAAAFSLRLPEFKECMLDEAGFVGVTLPGLKRTRCSAREACFQDAKLQRAEFRGTELRGALFSGADLRKADLRDAQEYVIDPRVTRVEGVRASLPEAAAMLVAMGLRLDP